MVRVVEWPLNVIPDGPEQVDQAIRALFDRAMWNDPITQEVRRELVDWFEHKWCPQAILVALDRTPDNTLQRRRGDRDDLLAYLKARLRCWYDDSPDADTISSRLKPPRPGQSFEQWWRVRTRTNRQSGERVYRPLSPQGQAAREKALRESRSKFSSADRVARIRASDAKRQAAMDLLGPEKTTTDTTTVDVLTHVGQTDTRDKLTANYAGRRALIINHPRVRAIVDRAARERRRLTYDERTVLRNAIHDAKVTGARAQLEAWNAGSGEILSPEGLRMLAYLDNAFDDDFSFDTLVALITAAVENSTPSW